MVIVPAVRTSEIKQCVDLHEWVNDGLAAAAEGRLDPGGGVFFS